jgi:hypothetical protein
MDYSYSTILSLLVFGIVIFYVARVFLYTPRYQRSEGFGGIAKGSGHPDCLRTLPEASELLEIVQQSRGNQDFQELQLILSKMACLKKDLLSPSGIVEATRYQTFDTNHDRINVADLCALCNSQNISPRDLDISFATWRDRGNVLLRKLCTEAHLTEKNIQKAEKLFTASWNDVYQISQSKCLKTDYTLQNGGQTRGDVGGFEPTALKDLRSYEFKYGGASASGWNGAV